jgi:hypothetical protein
MVVLSIYSGIFFYVNTTSFFFHSHLFFFILIFNHSWTVYTWHLVAVPFTSFGNVELILNYLYLNEIFYSKDMDVNTKNFFIGIYFFYFISNNCRLLTTVQMFDIIIRQLRYAILLALEMMNEWTPTFFLNIST